MKLNRTFFIIFLSLIAIIAGGAYGAKYLFKPTNLKIAIPKIAGADLKIFNSFANSLKKDNRIVNIEVVTKETVEETTQAFEKGEVQLVTARSDLNLPHNGNLVAIMRREQIILIAPKRSNVKENKDLKGKTIAVVRNNMANINFAKEFIEANNLQNIKVIGVDHADVGEAVKTHKADVYMLFGAFSNIISQNVIKDIAKESKSEPTILPVLMAATISGQSTKYYSSDVATSSYGTNPPRPDDDITTTSIIIALLAHSKVDKEVIAELSERLFAARRSLVDEDSRFRLIEAPDVEGDSPIKIHPGTVAQINGERQTFMERYSDYIYSGSIGMSALFSIFAALRGMKSQQDRLETAQKLKEVRRLVNRAHHVKSKEEAVKIRNEVISVVDRALGRAEKSDLDQADAVAIQLALSEIRSSLARFEVTAL